jgi:hypothetical protein
MYIAIICSIFFVCLLAACGNSISQSENKVLATQTNKVMLNLRMERNHCFGECPVYTLTIQPDGIFFFENVKIREKNELITKKRIEGKLSEEKINRIVGEIIEADFFNLKDSYADGFDCPAFWKDSPDVNLSVSIDGKEKIVFHSLGCKEKVKIDEEGKIYPQRLYDLENKIDEIVETKRWIGERE